MVRFAAHTEPKLGGSRVPPLLEERDAPPFRVVCLFQFSLSISMAVGQRKIQGAGEIILCEELGLTKLVLLC